MRHAVGTLVGSKDEGSRVTGEGRQWMQLLESLGGPLNAQRLRQVSQGRREAPLCRGITGQPLQSLCDWNDCPEATTTRTLLDAVASAVTRPVTPPAPHALSYSRALQPRAPQPRGHSSISASGAL